MPVAAEAPVTYVETQLRRRRRLAPSAADLARAAAGARADRGRVCTRSGGTPDTQPHRGLRRHPRAFRARFDRRRPEQRHPVLGVEGAAATVSSGVRRPPRLSCLRLSLPHGQPRPAGGPADRHLPARLSAASISSGSIARSATPALAAPRKELSATSCAGMPSNNLEPLWVYPLRARRRRRRALEAGQAASRRCRRLARTSASSSSGVAARTSSRTCAKASSSGGRGCRRSSPGSRRGAPAGSTPSIPTSSCRWRCCSTAFLPTSSTARAISRRSSISGRARACICTGTATTPRSPSAISRPRSAPA